MIGTKYATGGLRRITRMEPKVKLRFVGFILVMTCGAALLAWITRTSWLQLEQLQKEHAAVKSESFYLGVSLRSSVRSLNGKLLQFAMSRESSVRQAFLAEAGEFHQLVVTNSTQLTRLSDMRLSRKMQLFTDLELLGKIQRSFTNYVVEAERIFKGRPPPDVDSFQEVYEKVQVTSKELMSYCDQLVGVQSEGFAAFLGATQSTLADHKRLLQITVVLILGLAGMLAMLVYRGMIAPLRLSLNQSTAIIERQEKLASLGVLASGVAHEIRNPLTAIKFRLFSLKKAVPAMAGSEDASVIADELNRLERIVKDFLRFARPSDPELTAMPAERVLREAGDFLKVQFDRAGISLRFDLQEGVWVRADAQQMKQVLINLIHNAAEAIGRDGVITLRLRTDEAEFDGVSREAAILSVSDTGKGMAPEVQARLFDPFFTTKENGTGLGLAIAARIIEKHGGNLYYDTEAGVGTTFEIVLPRAGGAEFAI